MSSNHTYVSERAWNEMCQQVANSNAYVIRREEEARRLQQEAEARRRQIAATVAANRTAVNNAVQALNNAYETTLREVVGASTAQINAQSASFSAQIQGMLSQVRDLGQHISMADTRLENMAQQYQAAFQQIIAQQASAQGRAERYQTEMNRFLEQAEALNAQGRLPGEYRALQSMQQAVTSNIRAGDYRAALAVSQNGILNGARLVTRLTVLNEEYNNRLAAVRESAAALRTRFDRFDSRAGALSVDVAGSRREYPYDIAYWSNGAYGDLNQNLAQVESLLESGNATMEQLNTAQTMITNLGRMLDRCDQDARQNLASTVFVEDTAGRLHSQLTGRGWTLQGAGHHANEASNPYTLQYGNGNGDVVSIVVSAGERADQPRYAIEAFSDNEYRAQRIKDGVHASVREAGLQTSRVECRNDCHLNPTPQAFTANMVREALERQKL